MKYHSKSPEETESIARDFARGLRKGDVLALKGNLGSGKTVFTKGLAIGLDIPQTEVTSPTYVLIHEYLGGRLPLYHFDFYRLETKQQIVDLDLEHYFDGDGITVVEWGDKFESLIPERAKWFLFEVKSEKEREITLTPSKEKGELC